MLARVSKRFYACTRGWIILVVLAVFIGFVMVTLPGITAVSGDIKGLDTMFFYTPEQAFANVAAYTSEARATLNTFHLTADIVNPLLYTTFLTLLLSWLFQRGFTPESKMRKLNVIPLGALLFDFLENICITIMMSVYPAQPQAVAWLSTGSTMAKFTFIYVSLGLVLVGLVSAIVIKFSGVSSPSSPSLTANSGE